MLTIQDGGGHHFEKLAVVWPIATKFA